MNTSAQFERLLRQVSDAVTVLEVSTADEAVRRHLKAHPENASHEAWQSLLYKQQEVNRRQVQARVLGLSTKAFHEREDLVRQFIHLLRGDAGHPMFLMQLSEVRRDILAWEERFPSDTLAEEMLQTLSARERETLLLLQMQTYLTDTRQPALV